MEKVISWDEKEYQKGNRVRYRAINYMDYRGTVIDCISANIVRVKWDRKRPRDNEITAMEFVSNLCHI